MDIAALLDEVRRHPACVIHTPVGPPTLSGQTFFDRPYDKVRQWLRTLDPALNETVDGLRSQHLGIVISAPGANELSEEEL